MSMPVNNIIRSATRTSADELNILWMPHNGILEHFLFQTMTHKFYVSHDIQGLHWDTTMFPKSPNCFTLQQHNMFSLDTDFDAIVCNNRTQHIKQASIISSALHIPLILVEHYMPTPVMKKEDIQLMKVNHEPHKSIAVHTEINKAWNTTSQVIPYGIPTIYNKNVEKEDQLVIIGHFDKKDAVVLNEIIRHSKYKVVIVGDNPGVSSATTYQQTCEILQKSKFVLNMHPLVTPSMSMLLAMSAGCIPISNDNPFIKTKYSFNNKNEMLSLINKVEYSDTESEEQRVFIKKNYCHGAFISQWHKLFLSLNDTVYTRI